MGSRGKLDNDCLYIHHPSRRLDLQSPLALTPFSANHTPELIDNLYLTGVYSNDTATTSAFLIYIYVPEATPEDISNILYQQLKEMQQQNILSPTDTYVNSITAHPLTDTHHTTHLDDDPISTATNLTSVHLKDVPHAYIITAPTYHPTTYGLILLASRQHRWSYNIPNKYIPTYLPETLRKALLAQIPTITRKHVNKPSIAKDRCYIHCHDFQNLTPTSAYNLFRAAAILTLHKHITTIEDKQQNQTATSLDKLSQPTQALLQALDSIQPADRWTADTKQNTMTFTPIEVDYNPYRLQAQSYVLNLQDPRSINNIIKFSVKPPRIKSHHRGDAVWYPWWRTAILVQSPDTLPLPNINDLDDGHPTGHLHQALHQAKTTTEAFLSSIQELRTAHTQASILLKRALDGAFILAHQKRDTSTQATNYIISVADPTAYAMLATLTDPTKVTLPTSTIFRGQIRHQIATLNLTAHNRSILGREYAQLLTDPDITHLNNNLPLLQYNQTKGLIGRPSDKINWAITLLAHNDVLQTYEEGLQEDQEETPTPNNSHQQNKEQPPTPKTNPKTTPESSNKGEDKKMPSMARATPDPLKQMRQQQAAEAKLLAAQNRQREGVRKEQEKIRAAEAAEKKANQDRLANKKTPENTAPKANLPDPTQTKDKDPEILPDTAETEKVTTPEGDVAEISMDYTLSEEGEGEGDNISGNKELRGETANEDETDSKRLKQPLNTEGTE